MSDVTLDPGTTFPRTGGQITVSGGATEGKVVAIQLTKRPPDGTPAIVRTVGPVGPAETWSQSIPCSAGDYELRVWVVDKDPIVRNITVT